MGKMQYNRKADVGVTRVQEIVQDELNWIFREQPHADFGVDAHVELLTVDHTVTGQLLAIQIKTGDSYFSEPLINQHGEGWIFRIDAEHVTYWKNHCLPVIIILVDDKTKKAYWQHISSETLQEVGTKGKWKIHILKSQEFSATSVTALKSLVKEVDGDPMRNAMALAFPWMKIALSAEGLWMEAGHWINKSSGRSELRLFTIVNGEEQTIHDWPYVILPGWEFPKAIQYNFPWADIELDQKHYEAEEQAQFPDGYEPVYDENGEFQFDASTFDDEPVRPTFDKNDIRPYDVASGEVEMYRLRLRVNDLGNAYLQVEDFFRSR